MTDPETDSQPNRQPNRQTNRQPNWQTSSVPMPTPPSTPNPAPGSPPLTGRRALVTGASAGIGRAIALDLARAGARVVVNARREDKLAELVREIEQSSDSGSGSGPSSEAATATAVAGDAADDATIARMLDAAGGTPDLVVVNAGRGLAGSVMTSDPDQWESMIRVNLLGAAKLMRAAGERMIDDAAAETWPGRPRDIVVLGSTVGRHISPFSSMYGSTKFAVNSLAEAQRRELGPKGVRVSLIEPGIVKSEFQQVAGYDPGAFGDIMDKFGPVLEPEDIARTITFICAQPAHVHLCDAVIRATRQDYP